MSMGEFQGRNCHGKSESVFAQYNRAAILPERDSSVYSEGAFAYLRSALSNKNIRRNVS